MCRKEPTIENYPILKKLDIREELLKVLRQERVDFHIEKLQYILEKYYNVELISLDEAGEKGFIKAEHEDDDRLYKYRLKFKCHEIFCGNSVTRFTEYLFNV